MFFSIKVWDNTQRPRGKNSAADVNVFVTRQKGAKFCLEKLFPIRA